MLTAPVPGVLGGDLRRQRSCRSQVHARSAWTLPEPLCAHGFGGWGVQLGAGGPPLLLVLRALFQAGFQGSQQRAKAPRVNVDAL